MKVVRQSVVPFVRHVTRDPRRGRRNRGQRTPACGHRGRAM